MSLLQLLFNILLEVLAREIARKRNKRQIGNEEVKLSLFTDKIILYLENAKDSTQKKTLLELINKFRKVYKVNM